MYGDFSDQTKTEEGTGRLVCQLAAPPNGHSHDLLIFQLQMYGNFFGNFIFTLGTCQT